MALVRRIARPLLAAPFVMEGVRTALNPERPLVGFPEAFSAVDSAVAGSPIPSFIDARLLMRLTGALAAGAGVAYATNRAPRAAAVVMLATTTVGWAGRKKIWELKGEERLEEIRSLLGDAGLLGGLLLAAVDHDGRPSFGYQVNQFVERSQKNAAKRQRELEKKAHKLGKSARGTVKDVQKKLDAATA